MPEQVEVEMLAGPAIGPPVPARQRLLIFRAARDYNKPYLIVLQGREHGLSKQVKSYTD